MPGRHTFPSEIATHTGATTETVRVRVRGLALVTLVFASLSGHTVNGAVVSGTAHLTARGSELAGVLVQLKGANDRTQEKVQRTLEACGPGALEDLIAASDDVQNGQASQYLGDFPMKVAATWGSAIVSRLLTIVKTETPKTYRSVFAERTLAAIRPAPVKALTAILNRSDARSVSIVSRVLARIDDPEATRALVEIGLDAVPSLVQIGCEAPPRRHVSEAVTALGRGAFYAILTANKTEMNSLCDFTWQAESLARIGPAVVPTLVEHLEQAQDLDPTAQLAEKALSLMDPVPVEALLPLVNGTSTMGRLASARMLAGLDDPRVFDAFMTCLKSTSSDNRGSLMNPLRKECTRGLGTIGGPRAREMLTGLLYDPSWEVGHEAATALGKMYDPDLRIVLARCVRDCREGASMGAAHVLRTVPDEKARRLANRYTSVDTHNGVGVPAYASVAVSGGPIETALVVVFFAGPIGLVVGVVTLIGGLSTGSSGVGLRFAGAAALSIVAGVVCGGYPSIYLGACEHMILFTTPMLCLVIAAVWLGLTQRNPNRRKISGWRWGLLMSGFFVGYALGWHSLWQAG
jgi:HEAT repeat protein